MNKTPDARSDDTPRRSIATPQTTSPDMQEYEASLRAAVAASRESDELRAQKRLERRRKNNLLWSIGLAVVGVLLLSMIWGAIARRSRPAVVKDTTPVPTLTTIPLEVRSSEDGKEFVLSSTNATYKIVGKAEKGDPKLGADGEMSIEGKLSSGEMLEVCAGQECSQQRLSDENEEPELVIAETEIDTPYALCAREVGTGEVRRLAQFRVLVKVKSESTETSSLQTEEQG